MFVWGEKIWKVSFWTLTTILFSLKCWLATKCVTNAVSYTTLAESLFLFLKQISNFSRLSEIWVHNEALYHWSGSQHRSHKPWLTDKQMQPSGLSPCYMVNDRNPIPQSVNTSRVISAHETSIATGQYYVDVNIHRQHRNEDPYRGIMPIQR